MSTQHTQHLVKVLKQLLSASETYTSAIQDIHEASFYDDEKGVEEGNEMCERAYTKLVKASKNARDVIAKASGSKP